MAGGRGGPLADEDRPGRRRLLQARRFDDGGSGQARPAARQQLARVDADPELQRAAEVVRDAPLQRQSRMQGAGRVVLVRDRGAERDRERVAREGLDVAAAALDLVGGTVAEALEQSARTLGIAVLGAAGGRRDEDGRQLALAARSRRRLAAALRGRVEGRVLPEDPLLQVLQPAGRLDSELLDVDAARVAVRRERFGLPAGAIERQHQLPAQPLAERMLGDEPFELGRELPVPAERELRLDPLLDGLDAQLLEPGALGGGERIVRELGQRGSAPELERLAERRRRCRGVAVGEQPAPLPEEPLEPQRVDLAGVDFEHVAGWSSRQRGRAPGRGERLAQLRDPDAQRRASARRRLAAPDLVEQAVLGDDLAGAEQQAGEQRALPRPTERKPASPVVDLQWSENAEVHSSALLTLAPVRPALQGRYSRC